jgi:hypothetical protein
MASWISGHFDSSERYPPKGMAWLIRLACLSSRRAQSRGPPQRPEPVEGDKESFVWHPLPTGAACLVLKAVNHALSHAWTKGRMQVSVSMEGIPRVIFFSASCVRYNTHYPAVRHTLRTQLERKGGQPVETWLSADLNNVIYDFMNQLRRATELGWHRTKPDHYRAILAALEAALRQHHESSAAPASTAQVQPVPDWAEPHPADAVMTAAPRRSLLPLLGSVASRSR